jgi:hypothetical protein
MASEITVGIAEQVREAFAGSALTARQAKLYSQRLRRDMGQEGLRSFVPGDVDSYLNEATLLIQCALLERKARRTESWRGAVKRGAEILELLSQPSLKPQGTPIQLLAAAAYQVAELPAMALGLLRRIPESDAPSAVLRAFLQADFPSALERVRQFWSTWRVGELRDRDPRTDLTTLAVHHTMMCIGAVCDHLRTGERDRTDRALSKLESLAATFLYSRDHYSYLLASLTSMVSRRFVESSLWRHLQPLFDASDEVRRAAFTQFARSAFVNRRILVWPAQATGIERLGTDTSFVLCTPTGSGKTSVATLGAVQGLFAAGQQNLVDREGEAPSNLVLYLVPSRALAAEVETRLGQDLKGLAPAPVVVTGLYGGIDWGPTDAWIQNDQATVLICTFEKADALLRFLSTLFLNRVRLVIIDEAHMVEQDSARLEDLRDASSRSFRLEQLGARLLRARDDKNFRIIALSAVAARAAPALARWVSGNPNADPATSSHRSTRQMLGRLEINSNGHYTIRYDLKDGLPLRFDDERPGETPYVQSPFAPLPGGIDLDEGPEVRLRAPTLWAALHLAAERPDGSKPSVLISVTQNIQTFAADCVDALDDWPEAVLPNYGTVSHDDEMWNRCLASAADYFTESSVEYRLLRRGIAVHHGKMPGLLSRRLKALIDRGYLRVIIATSTLSEGVNLPVNYLLIASVYRGGTPMSLQEFTNLIGRAGRPGFATEGSALVVLNEPVRIRGRGGRVVLQWDRQRETYQQLIGSIEALTAAGGGAGEDEASSPLRHLLERIRAEWTALTGDVTPEGFATWLETTALPAEENAPPAYEYLDSLDAFLIAAIEEVEELRQQELPREALETELIAIWRRTYAFAAAREEEVLVRTWLARGRAIKTLYPNADRRRRIYKTSLTPRSASTLLDRADQIKARLQEGAEYARLPTEARFGLVAEVLAELSGVPSFRIATRLGRDRDFQDWRRVLRWWLAKNTLDAQPRANQITVWYEFVAHNFIHLGAWGLGSLIAVLFDVGQDGQPVRAIRIEDWPRSGLPWIAFWMKELITWGTLDPVAAFLLARGEAVDRPSAEAQALAYYETLPPETSANDILDPRSVRDWVAARLPAGVRTIGQGLTFEAALARPAEDFLSPRFSVMPLEDGANIAWVDQCGYLLARSARPPEWRYDPTLEFYLNVAQANIVSAPYLRYA